MQQRGGRQARRTAGVHTMQLPAAWKCNRHTPASPQPLRLRLQHLERLGGRWRSGLLV